jgi:hypothetical protein
MLRRQRSRETPTGKPAVRVITALAGATETGQCGSMYNQCIVLCSASCWVRNDPFYIWFHMYCLTGETCQLCPEEPCDA